MNYQHRKPSWKLYKEKHVSLAKIDFHEDNIVNYIIDLILKTQNNYLKRDASSKEME